MYESIYNTYVLYLLCVVKWMEFNIQIWIINKNNFEIISCNSKWYQHTSWIDSQHIKVAYAYVCMLYIMWDNIEYLC